jgi:hypothetical protein
MCDQLQNIVTPSLFAMRHLAGIISTNIVIIIIIIIVPCYIVSVNEQGSKLTPDYYYYSAMTQ